MSTIKELKEELIDRLEAEWDSSNKTIDDLEEMTEYDNDTLEEFIPHYYAELLQMVMEDNNLGYVDDGDLLPQRPTVYDIIQMSIWEELYKIFWDWENEKREEIEIEDN